uniref:Uncharacterized protein n=1 Tax=Manihot esculenta TaxID=3983 RepID=A0A2C9VYS6_MANES
MTMRNFCGPLVVHFRYAKDVTGWRYLACHLCSCEVSIIPCKCCWGRSD